MKYKDWLDIWLTTFVLPAAKQRTTERYKRIVQTQLLPLGEYQIDELTAYVLQNFVTTTLKCAPSTKRTVASVLKNSLKKAVECGVARKESASGILLPRLTEKPVECLTREEQTALEHYILHSGKPRLLGILLCLYTGLRVGELMALTWADIDLAQGTLTVSKSCHDSYVNGAYRKVVEPPKTPNSLRVLPLPKQLVGVLAKAKRTIGGKYVVGGDKTTSVRSYQRTFELLQIKLGIKHHCFHALRHTFATRALECGMDVKTLTELLGHKNPQVTLSRYAHSLMDHKRRMMNILGKLLE